jgi:hypothetical protein
MTDSPSFNLPTFNNGNKNPGTASLEYLNCLIDPASVQVRYPSEFSTPTALYHSVQFLDVYGNYGSGTMTKDIGRFSFYIRPVVGSPFATSYVTNCQVCYYAPEANWPADEDFSNSTGTRYVKVVDPNLAMLLGASGNNGVLKEIRPVAQSAWFAFTAPTITLGGQVAMALTDGDAGDYAKDYNTASQPGYPLQEYGNLAVFPNSYHGKITEGTYGFYKPYDEQDIVFRGASTPYDAFDYGGGHSYPALVISGQVMNTASGAFTGPIGRIRIDTVFEYVTSSRLVYSSLSTSPPAEATLARRALMGTITVMANDGHQGWFSNILSAGKSLLQKAAPAVGTALGGFLGGPAGAAAGGSIGNYLGHLGQSQPRPPPQAQAQFRQVPRPVPTQQRARPPPQSVPPRPKGAGRRRMARRRAY